MLLTEGSDFLQVLQLMCEKKGVTVQATCLPSHERASPATPHCFLATVKEIQQYREFGGALLDNSPGRVSTTRSVNDHLSPGASLGDVSPHI